MAFTMTSTATRSAGARRRHAVLPLAVAATVVLAGCGDDTDPDDTGAPGTTATQAPPTGTEDADDTGAAAEVDLAALIADPASYDDRSVTVRGVADNHGPGVFSIVPQGAAPGTATDDPSDGVDGLVVFHELGEGPADGDAVTVTGEVNDAFDAAAVEEALEIDISDDVLRTLGLDQQDVVITAESVTSG